MCSPRCASDTLIPVRCLHGASAESICAVMYLLVCADAPRLDAWCRNAIIDQTSMNCRAPMLEPLQTSLLLPRKSARLPANLLCKPFLVRQRTALAPTAAALHPRRRRLPAPRLHLPRRARALRRTRQAAAVLTARAPASPTLRRATASRPRLRRHHRAAAALLRRVENELPEANLSRFYSFRISNSFT